MPAERSSAIWRVAVDTGGTFTDCVARGPDGRSRRVKVLSSGVLRARLARVEREGAALRLEAEGPLPGDLRGMQVWRGEALVGVVRAHQGARLTVAPGEDTSTEGDGGDRASADGAPPGPGDVVSLGSGESAPLLAARLITATAADEALPPMALRLATTRGTNALLERRGEPVALFITRGLGDLLRIGDQQRPDIFARRIERPPPLFDSVVEVDERLGANGGVVRELDLEGTLEQARTLLRRGVHSAAVALVHAYREPRHERALGEALRGLGFTHVSLSSSVAPLIKLLDRAETTLVNAYLARAVGDFVRSVARGVGVGAGVGVGVGPSDDRRGARSAENDAEQRAVMMMGSAGGLHRAVAFQPKDSLLSGPAGGVVGAGHAGTASGFEAVLSFDMGGTSTDVARWAGVPELRYEQRVGGARLRSPMLAIETVAAGGGSVCAYRHGELAVGPQSAGAFPGPACYGAGGPLTITDVNLLLGRLSPARFGVPVDLDAAREAAERLAAQVAADSGDEVTLPTLLEGLVDIADERMADAMRRVSLRRGYEPARHAMIAFGGAGPQHACGVAERLGIGTVLVPRDAGLLSAVGLSCAALERVAQQQTLQRLVDDARWPAALWQHLGATEARARGRLGEDLDDVAGVIETRALLSLRYVGQDSAVELPLSAGVERGDDDALRAWLRPAFEQRYSELYGHRPDGREIELESVRVVATCAPRDDSGAQPSSAEPRGAPGDERQRSQTLRTFVGDAWCEVPCHERGGLAHGDSFDGPAVVTEDHATTWAPPGWRGEVDAAGALLLQRTHESSRGTAFSARSESRTAEAGEPATAAFVRSLRRAPAAVQAELFAGRLGSIAEQMGELLQRTALSTNVKERLDFSCTLLDPAGSLVVNAPHMPVHLGALGLCVREVVRALPLGPGDVAVTNHPGFGGSHLPDITVITPAHDADGRLLGYVASRAHHAEVGGSRPGSMPPDATCLADEGVVIAPRYLARAGEARWDSLRELLSSGPWPSRAVADNIADLRAAVAANALGARAFEALAAASGTEAVLESMEALARRAEREVRRALRQLGSGRYEAASELDDGTPLRVRIDIDDDHARVDFSGCGDVHPHNLNATPAIVRGAVIYVLRLLVDRPLPLNEGLMRAIELVLPEGSLLCPDFSGPAERSPAVVGGNVETSQRLCDILLEALGLCAHSQGTMNNLLFGDARGGYYETICGGHGAAEGYAGASAVHTHMTNTRITDVEVLEHRYPVRLERFAIRRGSGGAGRWRGGDGSVRELRFLAPSSVSLLSQRRAAGPRGLHGGADGTPGTQRVLRADGTVESLEGIAAVEVDAGDRVVVETPGAGGWGSA